MFLCGAVLNCWVPHYKMLLYKYIILSLSFHVRIADHVWLSGQVQFVLGV